MNRHRKRGWLSRFVRAIISSAVIFLLWVGASDGAVGDANVPLSGYESVPEAVREPPPPLRSCPSPTKSADHFLLVVSTIDGAVSALDMRTNGDLLWSVKADERPLLSASITNIQVNRDGVPTRLIPSLDGGLYEFDGEDIKAIPMTAESLLSSSVRITDNCVMVGGKEVGTYGVDVSTGQLSYQCTATGCKDATEAGSGRSNGDMLLITRNMQTVRAVDVNSGGEKWNFSVGQHDLLFIKGSKDNPGIEHDDTMPVWEDEDITLENCFPYDEDNNSIDEDQLKQLIKVVVSDGLIVGLNPEDPTQMSWSRKFSSPVAKAWILHRGKLETISLFDSKVVPSLSSSQQSFHHHKTGRGDPLLYVGTHKRQLYVQREEPDLDSCEKELPWIMEQELQLKTALLSVPRVTWRPYLSKAQSQTPLFVGNEPPQVPLLGGDGRPRPAHDEDESATSLMVWHENYPFDMGYYLYPSHVKDDSMQVDLDEPPEESFVDILPVSLWNWWKEVLAISLITSLFSHLVITRVIYRPVIVEVDSSGLNKKDSVESLESNDSSPALYEDKQTPTEFKSRFADEFECIEQLGKGGYGIVFRAKNKVDEQEYAVKRIALPNSDGALKKKMLREVRTLAMLDHGGIVRYFHSWIEDPPSGWQEERDKEYRDILGVSEGLSPMTDTTIPSTDPQAQSTSSHTPGTPGGQAVPVRKTPSLLADIMPQYKNDDLSLGLNSLPLQRSGTGSGEFSLHSNAEGSTDESGSFSLGGDQRDVGGDESKDSFSIVFQNTDGEPNSSQGEDEMSCSGDALPFRRYESGRDRSRSATPGSKKGLDSNEDSLSIVFENSCGSESKGSSGVHEHSKSAAFSDSSYGGSVDDNESGDIKKMIKQDSLSVDFTLSSRGGDELPVVDKDNEREKEGRIVEKKVLPKLYLYLQMQLCRLETLKDWLIANTLNRERMIILDIFEQIVCAVDYVHAKGLIHRDLKPSNIFFALDDTVKVGDFGLVTAAETQQHENSGQSPVNKASAKHTAEVGTQLYMSPEQIQKKPYDQKVDIFSLGLIFLELLMPFSTGMERVTTLQNARKGNFPERFCRELPVESELVMRLMSSNPQKRPTTQEILEHSLLKDFTPRRVGYRYRTISNCSNHSDPALCADQ